MVEKGDTNGKVTIEECPRTGHLPNYSFCYPTYLALTSHARTLFGIRFRFPRQANHNPKRAADTLFACMLQSARRHVHWTALRPLYRP